MTIKHIPPNQIYGYAPARRVRDSQGIFPDVVSEKSEGEGVRFLNRAEPRMGSRWTRAMTRSVTTCQNHFRSTTSADLRLQPG